MHVRPAELEDLDDCLALDHSFETEHVWQMEEREEDGGIIVTFRLARLPRPMRVGYPRGGDFLLESWQQRGCFLVAEEAGRIRGYLDMAVQNWHATGWIRNLVVAPSHRRRGVGTALLRAASRWAREHSLRCLIMEMQTKNYPAICFAQKHGFVFCGFHDNYYANQDIALFFALRLR